MVVVVDADDLVVDVVDVVDHSLEDGSRQNLVLSSQSKTMTDRACLMLGVDTHPSEAAAAKVVVFHAVSTETLLVEVAVGTS